MDELKNHVNQLFYKYRGDKQINELKEEVLSNLTAKVDDLMSSGMEYKEAVQNAKNSIQSIDHLIDVNKMIYINQWKVELIQVGLIECLIAWIVTIPLGIIGIGIVFNRLLLILCIAVGIAYFASRSKYQMEYEQAKTIVHYGKTVKLRKISWILWGLFAAGMTLFTTALHFGSNIWFSRPIVIDGPYQFAVLAIHYLLPFITIIIPLFIQTVPRTMMKYEAGESYEE